jgi:hypothetical protein
VHGIFRWVSIKIQSTVTVSSINIPNSFENSRYATHTADAQHHVDRSRVTKNAVDKACDKIYGTAAEAANRAVGANGHASPEVGIEEYRKNLQGISQEFHRNCMHFW